MSNIAFLSILDKAAFTNSRTLLDTYSMNLATFVRLFVPLQRNFYEFTHQFIPIFCIDATRFLETVPSSQDGPKSPKNGTKKSFGSFDKNLISSYVLFLLEYESTIGIPTFCRNLILEFYSGNL